MFTHYSRFFFSRTLFLFGVAAGLAWPQETIPAKYQDLHNELMTDLAEFDAQVEASWNHLPWPVAFSAELNGAAAARGADLLRVYSLDGVRLELDGLKALGVKAVTVGINFPMLHRPAHSSEAEYQEYLAFYRTVFQEIRARGLKAVVETQSMLADRTWTNWDVKGFYDSLTLDQYRAGRAQVARTIALEFQPDFLNVTTEPDTEATSAGKPEIATLDGNIALLNQILAALADVRTGIRVGGGFGTWIRDYQLWTDAVLATPVDYIDVHVYPVGRDFLTRTLDIADRAHTAGKGIAASETYSHKLRDSELAFVGYNEANRRNVFSFWAQADTQHLKTLIKLSHFKHFEYLSPFWSGYFRAYLPYSEETDALSTYAASRQATAANQAAIEAAQFTSTGLEYRKAILGFNDASAPAPPAPVRTNVAVGNTFSLTWDPTTDNVGVAGYVLYRNGVELYRGAHYYFVDTPPGIGATHNYTLAAFDAVGNLSAQSAPTQVSTVDTLPPAAPTGLKVSMTSPVMMSLTWNPAADNVGIYGYIVYRGTSPGNMSAVGFVTNSNTSFSTGSGARNATFYFAVQAMDLSYNKGPISSPVAITTPPTYAALK